MVEFGLCHQEETRFCGWKELKCNSWQCFIEYLCFFYIIVVNLSPNNLLLIPIPDLPLGTEKICL